MKEEKYIIGIVVGYILKIMKARKVETKFKKEFAPLVPTRILSCGNEELSLNQNLSFK